MARTPYADKEAEAAYQSIADDSSKPSADEEPAEITDPNGQDQKNNMLRTMSVRSVLGKIQKMQKSP